jgi:FlaA1/EpsC-like NDP-sugar epimerase
VTPRRYPRGILRVRGSDLLPLKRLRHVAADAAICVVAFWSAYQLRFDFAIPASEFRLGLHQTPLVVALHVGALVLSGVYHFIWRYVGLREVRAFATAVLAASAPLLVLRFTLPDWLHEWRVPLSVIFLTAMLVFFGTLTARIVRRIVYEQYQKPRRGRLPDAPDAKRILLIGAGRAGKAAADEIRRIRRADLEIQGFVDDDPGKVGAVLHGLRVLGTTADLQKLVGEFDVDHVVIAMAQATRQDIRRIVSLCERIPIKARIIPSLPELLDGNVSVSRIRDVRIDDLLGRPPVQLDQAASLGVITGKTVLVTGAGGSIGSELARQVLRLAPAKLILAERAEFALFNVHYELVRAYPDASIVPVVADISNRSRVTRIFETYAPQVVVHAAAHKHVPLMELNPSEAVVNNSFATRMLGEVAGAAGVEVFVLISTDKAVRPTSVMGASKRLAELAVQSLNDEYPTRYVAVRFGNVIGSSGSVIPIFRAQIEKGGPVTVTHPDMVRYFMTIPEAAQLSLEAAALGEGGEIFVLDMGEPVKIVDLAKDLIRLAGLRPFDDIDILFTGMRPGEKLFEEIEMSGEQMTTTRHPKIFIGKIQPLPQHTVRAAMVRLERAVTQGDADDIKQVLGEVIPEAQLTVPAAPHVSPVASPRIVAAQA